jgi:hypothetical protein
MSTHIINRRWPEVLFFVLGPLLCVHVQGQAPPGFRYQAVIRDAGGTPVASQAVSLRIGVREGAPNGTLVYQETHGVNSDPFGLVALTIGEGTPVSGSFSAINWGGNSHYLQMEVDLTGGTTWTEIATAPLVSVPYALYANSAGSAGAAASTMPTVQVFTASGMWTKPVGLSYVVVEVVGGGGGGGGASAANGALGGGGGGGGGYARKVIPASSLASSVPVTVGAGGVPGSMGGDDGDHGGNTAFGPYCSATGGAGGAGSLSEVYPSGSGSPGGVGTNGDLNAKGGGGGAGTGVAGSSAISQSGSGGTSVLGGGAEGVTDAAASIPGKPGGAYGGGGSGGYKHAGDNPINGGAGAPGAVIVTEYY